jgi:hypothetical protein
MSMIAPGKRSGRMSNSPTYRVFQDRIITGQRLNVANAAGAGAGQAVTATVTFLELPPFYQVLVSPKQDCTCFVGNRTTFGFDVTLNPRLAANTLAAGNFDVLVLSV